MPRSRVWIALDRGFHVETGRGRNRPNHHVVVEVKGGPGAAVSSLVTRYRPATSSFDRGRVAPGGVRPSRTGPIRTRTNRRTGKPSPASMRRTSRLRPSPMTRATAEAPLRASTTVALIALASPSSNGIPAVSRRRAARDTSPLTSTRYSFSTPYRGCWIRWASSPSFVRISSPSESRSSRPTGKTRGPSGMRSRRDRAA